MRVIDEVMTIAEAAERWKASTDAVKKSCQGQKGNPPRFKPDEFRKSAHAWLVTRAGMERLYGKQKND